MGCVFGGLRQLRDDAGLTQEELAEAARVSQRAVSDLERGINRTARKDRALLLADALSLSGHTRELFIAAARGRAPAAEVLAAARVGSVMNDELRSFRAVALIDSLPGRTVLAALWMFLVACQSGHGRAWAAI